MEVLVRAVRLRGLRVRVHVCAGVAGVMDPRLLILEDGWIGVVKQSIAPVTRPSLSGRPAVGIVGKLEIAALTS